MNHLNEKWVWKSPKKKINLSQYFAFTTWNFTFRRKQNYFLNSGDINQILGVWKNKSMEKMYFMNKSLFQSQCFFSKTQISSLIKFDKWCFDQIWSDLISLFFSILDFSKSKLLVKYINFKEVKLDFLKWLQQEAFQQEPSQQPFQNLLGAQPHKDQLHKDQKLTKISLAKINCAKMNLTKINLTKINLTKINLPKINLTKINLPKIKLTKINLTRIDLPKINLTKINLTRINLPKDQTPQDQPHKDQPPQDQPHKDQPPQDQKKKQRHQQHYQLISLN